MSVIADIKNRVEKLTAQEQAELLEWLVERDYSQWDAQIASDLRTGKLDQLIADAKADRDAGKARDL